MQTFVMILLLTSGAILSIFYISYYLFMLGKSRESFRAHENCDSHPPISIVLPTYNEEATITSKLKNLAEQGYPMEIIIIDSNSQDQTVSLAEKFAEENNMSIRIIKEEKRSGKASALNKAFKYCSHEIVAITDSDSEWEKGIIEKAVSHFLNWDIGAVTGRQILKNPNQSLSTKLEKSYREIYEVLRVGESILDSTPIFHGEISCYRKGLIDRINEKSMADDSELAIKIRKKGFRSIYDPNMVFYEYAPPSLASRFNQKVRRGQGLIKLFLQEKGIIFNRKYGKFGTIIFPAEFFMHIISPILLSILFGSFVFLLLFSTRIIFQDLLILIGIILGLSSLSVWVLTKINVFRLILSFLNCQFILLISLIYCLSGRSQHKWRKIEEIRELWEKEQKVDRSAKINT